MKTQKSFATNRLDHHRNMIVLMVAGPVVVMLLTMAVLFGGNTSNQNTEAQATCTRTITSGSISTTINSLSSGQTLCLDGTFNQSVVISKAGVNLTSVAGKTSRINGQFRIQKGADNVRVTNLYLNGAGTIVSPHILANGAYFGGNQVTNQGATRGICFAIGETDIGTEVNGITIDGNRIFRCGTVYHDQGIYAEFVRNAVIRNNYIYDNPDFAIQFYPSAQNSIFEYNVVDGNARGITYSSEGSRTSSGNIVRYNIITNSPNAANINYYWGGPVGTGNRAENNCLYNGSRPNLQSGLTNYVTVTGSVIADPMYVDRANKDFRLRSGSPCAAMGPRTASTSPTPPPPAPAPTPPPPSPSPSPTPPPSPGPSPAPISNAFGKTSVGSGWTSMSPDAKRGSRFTYSGPSGQELYQVGGYLRGVSSLASGSQTVNVAVYSDNGGQPGSLLASGVSSRTVSAGQSQFRADFTLNNPLRLTSGTNYWLMYHSGGAAGIAEYSHDSVSGALRWQSGGTDSFADGPSPSAGSFNTDNKNATIWGLYRSVSTGSSPSPTPPPPSGAPSTPPPITIPGSSPDTPVAIPDELPRNSDGSLTGDFNGDGLNDVAVDSNGDNLIDPNSEIIIDGTNDRSLTDTSANPLTPSEYASLFGNSALSFGESYGQNNEITIDLGPLPEATLPKSVAYSFLGASGVTLAGVGAYLLIVKFALFAGIRARLGL